MTNNAIQAVAEIKFDLENLSVTAGCDVAFAHSFIRCGGTTASGRVFEDLVRATFCLRKIDGLRKISHQHISMSDAVIA